jgi:hypothetical protein
MADNRGQAYHRITLVMWISLLLTAPTWIYGIINIFDLGVFNEQMIENGLLGRFHLLAVMSILLPVLGLVLALVARLLIGVQKARYNFYPAKSKQLLYNNILMAYFITLVILSIIYLGHSS